MLDALVETKQTRSVSTGAQRGSGLKDPLDRIRRNTGIISHSGDRNPQMQGQIMTWADDQLRAIIDTIPTQVWSARPDGSAEFLNQPWLDYTGQTLEQALDWGWTAALHPGDRDRAVAYWRSILVSGEPGEIELRLRRFDGGYRWFLSRGRPLRDAAGSIVKWCGTNTDIDERRRAEEDVRASALDLRLIVDSIPGFVVTLSAAGEVELLNRRVLEYFGKTSEELKNWATSDAVHPDDLPRVIDTLWRSVETGQPYVVEARHRRPMACTAGSTLTLFPRQTRRVVVPVGTCY